MTNRHLLRAALWSVLAATSACAHQPANEATPRVVPASARLRDVFRDSHPDNPHFNDQASRYAAGDLREVYFYPDQRVGHTTRTYRPGDR